MMIFNKDLTKTIIAIISILTVTSIILHLEGRLLICSCGKIFLWVGNIWSADNSQHLFDPYSFTHLLHGFLFSWLLMLLIPKVVNNKQLIIAVIIASGWEVIENSNFIINKYRADTISIGYQGDTIINSLSDIICCIIGFIIAKSLGVRKSIIIFALTEIILFICIRDSLILNIIMLLCPIKEIKQWQLGK